MNIGSLLNWGDVGMCGFGDVGMCGFVDEIGGK